MVERRSSKPLVMGSSPILVSATRTHTLFSLILLLLRYTGVGVGVGVGDSTEFYEGLSTRGVQS